MKKLIFILLAHIILSGNLIAQEKKMSENFDREKIIKEIKEKFLSYNGKIEDHNIEMWSKYFLNSKEIGNIHYPQIQIGYQSFYLSTKYFLNSAPKGKMLFENIEIYPINAKTAWAKGDYTVTINGKEHKTVFHDSLIKTSDGWRVFLSVVVKKKI